MTCVINLRQRESQNLRKKELLGCLVENLVGNYSVIVDIVDLIVPFFLRESPRDTETIVTMVQTS